MNNTDTQDKSIKEIQREVNKILRDACKRINKSCDELREHLERQKINYKVKALISNSFIRENTKSLNKR